LAVEDLLNKNLDAVVADSIIAADFVLANDNYSDKLTVTGSVAGDVEQIAMAVKKGNSELLNILNENIAALKADGTIAALKDKWNIL
jgi:polar amino acid transport system substrate-binding protein